MIIKSYSYYYLMWIWFLNSGS